MFAFLSAIIFIIMTAHFWLGLGVIWFLVIFTSYLILGFVTTFAESFLCDGYHCMDFGQATISFISTPFVAFGRGIISSFDPLQFLWQFARYEHPWWAFLISIILFIIWDLYTLITICDPHHS